MNLVHEGGGEDDLVINWHAAPNQARVSPLSVDSQVAIVAVPAGGEKQSNFDCIIDTQIPLITIFLEKLQKTRVKSKSKSKLF